MWNNYQVFAVAPGVKLLMAVLIIWSVIWKGVALWKAARNSHTVWYVVLLIVNTVGILEIIYIFGFSKKRPSIPPPAAGQPM
jgi:methionyl-tRNA synthetase